MFAGHALGVGKGGHEVIVDPAPSSARAFEGVMQLGLHHPSTLGLLVDPSHSVTIFVAGTVDFDADRVADLTAVQVPVDSIATRVIGSTRPARLLSITTNNSERGMLRGIGGIIDAGLQYLCLARAGERCDELVDDLGFNLLYGNDRGFRYLRRR